MSDTPADSNPHRSALDRAREDRELFPLRGQAWDTAMTTARDMRRTRAAAAAADTIRQAHSMSGNVSGHVCAPPADEPAQRWSVRGEVRCREHFGHPHPGDFPGGLPLPLGKLSLISLGISRLYCHT